jgi:soluble lytic murein transglycosylase-like protein
VQNVRAGAAYLRTLLDRFGDLKSAIAAYNAGPGAVSRYGGVPPFAETRVYVERVMDAYRANLRR